MPRITEEELQSMLQKNPKLRIHQTGGTDEKCTRALVDQISKKINSKPKEPKPSKYRNIKVYVYKNGFVSKGEKVSKLGTPEIVFDSIKEYERWGALQMLERAGAIRDLQRQVPMEIAPKAVAADGEKLRAIVYKADFMYINTEGQIIVEDVKPFDKKSGKYRTTKDFNLKWKLLKAKYTDRRFRMV